MKLRTPNCGWWLNYSSTVEQMLSSHYGKSQTFSWTHKQSSEKMLCVFLLSWIPLCLSFHFSCICVFSSTTSFSFSEHFCDQLHRIRGRDGGRDSLSHLNCLSLTSHSKSSLGPLSLISSVSYVGLEAELVPPASSALCQAPQRPAGRQQSVDSALLLRS